MIIYPKIRRTFLTGIITLLYLSPLICSYSHSQNSSTSNQPANDNPQSPYPRPESMFSHRGNHHLKGPCASIIKKIQGDQANDIDQANNTWNEEKAFRKTLAEKRRDLFKDFQKRLRQSQSPEERSQLIGDLYQKQLSFLQELIQKMQELGQKRLQTHRDRLKAHIEELYQCRRQAFEKRQMKDSSTPSGPGHNQGDSTKNK